MFTPFVSFAIVVGRDFRVVGKVTHVLKKGSRLLDTVLDDTDGG